MYRILVADDEAGTRKAMVRALELSGYQVKSAANGKEVFTLLEIESFDLLLLDLRMPEMDGMQVMQRIITEKPDLIVVVLTAHATLDSAITAVKIGAADYLQKPQSMENIKNTIQNALRKKSTEKHRQQMLKLARQTLAVLQSEDDEKTVTSASQKTNCEDVTYRLNCERRQLCVLVNDEEYTVDLTADQLAIITYLSTNQGKILSVREIARHALGYPELDAVESQRIIRPHILRLRRRLKQCPFCGPLIETVRGAGYVIACQINLTD